jgi:hypothetical protein
MTPRVKLRRRLTLAALLTVAAVVAVLAAHEEQHDGGLGLSLFGCVLIVLVLGAAAWRGGWRSEQEYYFPLTFAVLGLSFLVFGGPAVVTEVVLTHRGVPVQVEVSRASLDEDGGGGTYTLVLPGGSTPLRGTLRAGAGFAEGERFTVLVDRGRFVRPMLPEDVDPAFPAAFVLAGAGILGSTVLRSGFPLARVRRG